MKKQLIILAMLLTGWVANAQFLEDYIFASDNFIAVDKQYHFVGGAGFATVGYFMGYELSGGKRSTAIWTGIATGTGVNLIKEITDISKTGFNTSDLSFGIVGSVVGTLITDVIFNRKNGYVSKEKRKLEQIKIQSDYTDGWEDGYCEGWKDVKGRLAVCPVAPVAPVMDASCDKPYNCGYNLGFKAGRKKANQTK